MAFTLATSETAIFLNGTNSKYDPSKSSTVVLGKIAEVQELVETSSNT